jgi:hypothetical protein
MGNSSTAVLWLRGGARYNVWDNANEEWTIRTAAYTAQDETIEPQTTQVFTFVYSTINANLIAKSADVDVVRVTDTTASTSPTTGALTVAGGAGIAGALNVGGAAVIGEGLDVEGKSTFSGILKNNSVYAVPQSKLFYANHVPNGTLYNRIITAEWWDSDLNDMFIPCSGYYSNYNSMPDQRLLIQYIRIRTDFNKCYLYGPAGYVSGTNAGKISITIVTISDEPQYSSQDTEYNILFH